MTSENPPQLPALRRYSAVAIVLHWLLALAMAFQLALGFAMPKDESGFAAYQLHKSVGIAILLLTLARLAWRIVRRPPPPVEVGIGGLLAKLVHVAFYTVLILGPLTGWLLVSAAPLRVPTLLFGAIPWPHLPAPAGIYDASVEAHEILAWIAIGLFVLHVAGALRHHLLLHDRLLERMAPGGSAAVAAILAAAVLLVGGATFALSGRSPQGAPAASGPSLAVTESTAPLPAETETPAVVATAEPTEEADATATPATQAPPVWTVRPGGRLGFAVSNGGDQIQGTFAKWSGTIVFDPDRPETADISIGVDLASATVGDPTQNEMLQGAEFFAVAANPRATWRATSVRRTAPNRYAAQGMLTLKGVSRAQTVTFTLSGDGLRRSVRGSATIDRGAFGVGTGSSAENLGPRVSLDFAFDAIGKPG